MHILSPLHLAGQPFSPATLAPLIADVHAYLQLCGGSADLRHSGLAAHAELVFPKSCHSECTPQTIRAFDKFHRARKVLCVGEGSNADSSDSVRLDGRLLMVTWRMSLFDGACSPITSGFINDDGMLGWDTWLALVALDKQHDHTGLLCWIPAPMICCVNDAIRIDAAQCMSWVSLDGLSSPASTLHGWGKSLDA